MSMIKVVYNDCYGGFGLSDEAVELGRKLSGNPEWASVRDEVCRHDRVLIQVIEQLGSKTASGLCAELAIRKLPAGTRYVIDEYDGAETVKTPDDFDWVVAS